jgi:hypothetical protein
MVATTMSSLFVALFALVASSFRTRAAGGDPRASPPTCGLTKERAASLAPLPLRPLMGCVVPILVRLAGMSRSNSAHEPSEPAVESTPHSRRTAQVGYCGGAIHGGQIFASAPQTAFPGLVNTSRDRCDELCTTILPTISGPERI